MLASRVSRFVFALCCSVVLLCVGTTRADAQAALLVLLFGDKVASETFYFSIKGGVNLTNLDGEEGTKNKTGFNFGLLATIKVSDKLLIVPEFSPLSPRGAKNLPLEGDTSNITETSLAMNYIDVPVIVKFYPTPTFNLGAGPFVSFLTGGSINIGTTNSEGAAVETSTDYKSHLNSIDYGVAFELGYSLLKAHKGKGVNLHARYLLGMADIMKDNTGDAVTNSAFQFFVSLPFIVTPEEASAGTTEN